MNRFFKTISCMAGALLLAVSLSAGAAPLKAKPKASADVFHPERITKVPEAPEDKPFAEHFVVFHISLSLVRVLPLQVSVL